MADRHAIASVVIPAHNEERVIARCLGAVLDSAEPGELEVVVACNGCTDNTAEIAREYSPDVCVVECPEPSKTTALNAGDARADTFPRLYLDADVIVDTDSIRLIVAALAEDEVMAAAPEIRVDDSRSSWIVRAYYRVWAQMDWAESSTFGSGSYALSEEGRSRFGAFPSVLADDYWVNAQFSPQERRRVKGASSTVLAARTLRPLIRRKARVLAYARLVEAELDEAPDGTGSRGAGLLSIARGNPRLIPLVVIYVAIAVATNGLAAWNIRRGKLDWVSDR